MNFQCGKLHRLPLAQAENPETAWGTLGPPDGPPERANLLHLYRSPSVTLRHAFYAPGILVPFHAHHVASFVYGDGGPCKEIGGSGGSQRRLTYRPAGYRHALRYEGPTDVIAIELTGDFGPLPDVSVGLPATLYGEVWNMLSTVALGEAPSRIDEAAARLAEQTGALAPRKHPAWLTLVLDRMHTDWDSVPSARALADEARLSTSYLCRAFRQFMGVTTRQYGLLLRLDRARHRLWSTDASLSEVAAETGFTDQSHLCRTLAASVTAHRPGGFRAIRPDRIPPHSYRVTDAGARMTTSRFVGSLPSD